ncbi:MAG: selenocysteine-specific translation elongation factor [Bacteroidota bacterium]
MKHLIMGTAGHVDHGKTSLIKALTNIDCDTHKEEKRRGITINLGFSHMELPDGTGIGIIDVPGHKDFINTMVGGACGIDFVLLVIAADSGIMPQTIEHINIIHALNVKKGLVALTKSDLVDEELTELARMEISEMLLGTSLENAPVIAVSSVTGSGLDDLKTAIAEVAASTDEKEKGTGFRMYIDRIFTVKGLGSVVTGSVLNGETSVGKELYILPGMKQKFRIKGIERHGKPVESVMAGDRAAINIAGLKAEDFSKGMVLIDKLNEPVSMIDASVSIFRNTDAQIGIWSTIIFHSGTFECQAKMHLLNSDILQPGEQGIVQIHLEKPAVLQNRDAFIIRSTSADTTYGGGTIIDIRPLHHRRRRKELVDNLEMLAGSMSSEGGLAGLIKIELNKNKIPVSGAELAAKLNVTPAEIEEAVNCDDNIIVYESPAGKICILAPNDTDCREAVTGYVKAFHEKFYLLKEGITTTELYSKLGFSGDKTAKLYADIILERMANEGAIQKLSNTWVLKGREIVVDDRVKKSLHWIEKELLNYELQKPVMPDVEASALENGISRDDLKLFLK